MGKLTDPDMRAYLGNAYSSINRNKIRGTLAEIDFRDYIVNLGFGPRISAGGWILRSTGEGEFGHNTVVAFPETIKIGVDYSQNRALPMPTVGLHTICATFHQIGIRSYFCSPREIVEGDATSVKWSAKQLGVPHETEYLDLHEAIVIHRARVKRYNFLSHHTDTSSIPMNAVEEQFSIQNLLVSLQNQYIMEVSDIDGILWGQENTYPIEIKEKTAGIDARIGQYFGLDIGPFVKLAFYAAKRGNLHSIYVVREIDNEEDRGLIAWRYITFSRIAQFASWIFQGGGQAMGGGMSGVVKIPKSEFSVLDQTALGKL